MEKEFGTFRKSAFGGFNRKDVIEYIEKMKNETYEYKLQVEETVKGLNEKICELESAASFIADSCTDDAAFDSASVVLSCESVGDIKQATKQLKFVADELCRNLGDFIEKLTRKGLCDIGNGSFGDEGDVSFSFENEEKSADKVSEILSAMSFLEKESGKTKFIAESQKPKSTDVEEILSTLSFLG